VYVCAMHARCFSMGLDVCALYTRCLWNEFRCVCDACEMFMEWVLMCVRCTGDVCSIGLDVCAMYIRCLHLDVYAMFASCVQNRFRCV
jgi:hypothetical protein